MRHCGTEQAPLFIVRGVVLEIAGYRKGNQLKFRGATGSPVRIIALL